MADYITTYSGTHFYPTAPNMEDLHIADIAHALSLLCRGNGHVKTFFSVGQHCIFCCQEARARGLSPRVQTACLLHDAGEAYLSDVPRPFKQHLAQYKIWENKLLNIIYDKYLGSPLTEEEARLVKEIDDDMLYFDLLELLNESPDRPRPKLQTSISYEVLPFEVVEQRYLELYKDCRRLLHS